MKKEIGMRVRDKFVPYFVFPAIVGIASGVMIFAFKIASSFVMSKSTEIYAYVRENPAYLPFLLLGAVLLGGLSALILKYAKECRGGGIPTAVATIRGLIPLKWIQCLTGLFGSSMLTYLAGVPLGNEGPSVQMGAAVGKGISGLFGKKNKAWERYNMTGGASAGFAIATGSPLSGIVFALEEMHRRFSPPVFIVASVAVLSGKATSDLICGWFDVDTTFFNFEIDKFLPFKYLWVSVLIGVVCGICANLLTNIYHILRKFAEKRLVRVPFSVKIMLIFLAVALVGFAGAEFVGSGHSLIEMILERHTVWYVMLIALLVRSMIMILANNSGVSGGLFVPTLALGAIIASLISDGLIALGVIGAEYYQVLVIIGIASFLSASSRIPLTALTFAAEALCVASNLLPVAAGVVAAYLVVEILGVPSFTDTVIESKLHNEYKDKARTVVDSYMTVKEGALAVGMEVRDVLWPPTCTILSIEKSNTKSRIHSGIIEAGDVLHLHYRTYDRDETLALLVDILGDCEEHDCLKTYTAGENHFVPENDE